MYRRGEDRRHDLVLDANKLRRRGTVMLDHVRRHGTGHESVQLIDWCWVMSRRWAGLDDREARGYALVAEWLEAITIGGPCSRGLHLTDAHLLDPWQLRVLDRFQRRV